MKSLVIPVRLEKEFQTVETLWDLKATTPYLDALILSWVKYEKQLRKLFAFLLYQHAFADDNSRGDIEKAIASNRNLYPDSLFREIETISGKRISDLVGPRYAELSVKIAKTKKYRDKVLHGQISGSKIKPDDLKADVVTLIEWINLLAEGAEAAFGYDGIKRNTYKQAKICGVICPTYFSPLS